MSTTGQPASLSEISHLFLSSLRDRQTQGAARPQRIPPRKNPSVDLTPEEFGEVTRPEHAAGATEVPPVKVVLASQFGPAHMDVLQRYAASIASSGRRVGLIVIDAAEFQILTFEPAGESTPTEAQETHSFDPRLIRDAINELCCDLDLWLLAVANPRVPEARSLIRKAAHWTLLAGCDHDAVVAAYRMLKIVEEVGHPRLSMAVVSPKDHAEAEATFRRLAGVAGQFLRWPVENEPAVHDACTAQRCTVIRICAATDKAQLAANAHWEIVEELLEKARCSAVPPVEPAIPADVQVEPEPMAQPIPPMPELKPEPKIEPMPVLPPVAAAPAPGPKLASATRNMDVPEVIDIGEMAADPQTLLTAVMSQSAGEFVECPVRPPMCPGARLAVTRERRVMLLAVAGAGLGDLRAIGQAMRWLAENRNLLAMAMPQFSLDARQTPGLRLLVDHADADAELLRPLFELDTVQIQTYRRLRWAGRTGLLLEAA